MRIQIDATPLLLRSAGVKNYFYYWIRHLRREAGDDKVLAFPFLERLGPLTHEESVAGPLATWPRLALLYFVNLFPAIPAIDWVASRADVFHLSNQIRNPPTNVPLTATIHDMTCWLMPELHTPANVVADKAFADRTLKRAAGLIAVSENTKRDAVELLDLDPDRVHVIYSGIAEPFFSTSAAAVLRVAEKYELKGPYILYVGTIEPRKNVDTLLDAYQQLPPSIRGDVKLVIAGPMGWASESTRRRLEESKNGVRYLGYIPEDDLPSLMVGATVFTYLSRYEGFGFPVAQSMACGVPVVVSNSSSLPEVAGDAGLLVDPESPAAVAATLDHLLTSAALRSDLSRRGRVRAEQFRWEVCARRSLDFFHNLP